MVNGQGKGQNYDIDLKEFCREMLLSYKLRRNKHEVKVGE